MLNRNSEGIPRPDFGGTAGLASEPKTKAGFHNGGDSLQLAAGYVSIWVGVIKFGKLLISPLAFGGDVSFE